MKIRFQVLLVLGALLACAPPTRAQTPASLDAFFLAEAVCETNVARSGLATSCGGVALNTSGQRVLLTAQTLPEENGLHVVRPGAWGLLYPASSQPNIAVLVTRGASRPGWWRLVGSGLSVLWGTTPTSWVRADPPAPPAPGIAGNVLTDNGTAWVSQAPAGMQVLQAASFSLTTDQSTTSGTLADITGASASMTTVAGSRVDVQCSFSTSTTTVLGANVNIVLGIDSASDVGVTQTYPALSNAAQGGSISRLLSGLSAGAHTFKLRWSTTSNARIRAASAPTSEHASCVFKEIK